DVVGSDLQWARIDHNIIYNTLADARVGTRKYGIYLDYGGGGVNRIRATVDHNVVWDVNNPMTVNTGWDVHIFNNVFMAVVDRIDHKEEKSTALTITLKMGEAANAGKNIRVYNNILNEEPYLSQGPNAFISILNNITDARGEVLANLFADATNPVMSARDYRLKETAAAAIDKGVSVDEFTTNYTLDAEVQGVTDLGAYEWGTFLTGPDTEAPSVPSADQFVVSEKGASSFRLRWEPSADNVGVAFYEVYANGKLFKQTGDTTLVIDGLTLSTTYQVAVMAIDGSGNRSELSSALEVKTILNNTTISQTTTAPVIDGTKEAAWGETLPVANVLSTAPSSAADASGSWTSLWDGNNLYIYIDANDDEHVVDSGNSWWEDDHIELYIDADGSRPNGYTTMQFQYAVRRGSNVIIDAKPWFNRSIANIQVANVEKPNGEGYAVEIKIPFANLGVAAEAYKFIGIDVQIGDDDNGGSEDTRMGWFSPINNVHQNPSLMALAQLVEAGKADDIKPTVPTGLTASAVTPNGFTISWAASADNFAVLSYEVFVNGNLAATPSGTSLTLSELTAGTTYSVQVKAKDRFGNLSDPSSILNVMTPTRDSGVKYEAELAALTAGTMVVSSVESGFSGTGYVTQSPTIGAAITFTVQVPKAGAYPVVLRYSGNSRFVPYVNGTAMTEIRLSGTPTPNDWTDFAVGMTLRAGANTIAYRYESGDNFRRGNLDYILVYPAPGADSEAPTVPANVTVSNITHTGFTLSWAAATDDSGVAPGYEVYQDGVLVGSTTATTYDVAVLPGTYGMTVKAVDAAGNQSDASDNQPVTTVLRGVVTRELWTNIGGTSVADIPVHTKPASATAVYSLEDPTPSSSLAQYNNFGQRIRGYIIPSATATYYFYIAADNSGEFWLSTDDQPANKGTAPVALVKNTKARGWDKELRGQKSAGIALVAGKKYYFEALMKEFDGGNNLSIGWTTDPRNKNITLIGGDHIEAYVPSVPVVWMMVSPKGAGLATGETKQMEATIYPGNATNQAIAWTSSNTGVVTVDNTGLVSAVGLGSATVTASVGNGAFTAAAEFSVEPPTVKGLVVQEIWRWIGDGRSVADIPLTRTPSEIRDLTSIEDPSPSSAGGIHNTYGQRIRGYIIPSATATYYFYIASDDHGQLWLSSDYNPANKGTAPVAHVTSNNAPLFNNGGTGQREWTNSAHAATQKSAGKQLIAGKKYYFEALMKQRYGFNHLAIGWTTTTNNTSITVIGGDNIGKYLGEGCVSCHTDAGTEREGQMESLGLMLRPNPADRQVTIDLSGFAGESEVQVKMTDINGKLFVSQQVQLGKGEKRVTVPVSHLSKGLFVVTVQGSKTTKMAKLVITR
ncbi:MAG: Ig-like domain-containing protein, partial [Cytophagales bacterium]|nr:Ig-like domain-containing protein [Cytophagales bacterium]